MEAMPGVLTAPPLTLVKYQVFELANGAGAHSEQG